MEYKTISVLIPFDAEHNRLPIQCGEVVPQDRSHEPTSHWQMNMRAGHMRRDITVQVYENLDARISRDTIDYAYDHPLWSEDGNIWPVEDIDLQSVAVHAAQAFAYPEAYTAYMQADESSVKSLDQRINEIIAAVRRS